MASYSFHQVLNSVQLKSTPSMSSWTLSLSLSSSASILTRRHSLSSSIGSRQPYCLTVVPRSPLLKKNRRRTWTRRVDGRHKELTVDMKQKDKTRRRVDTTTRRAEKQARQWTQVKKATIRDNRTRRRVDTATWRDDELTGHIGEMTRAHDEMTG